MHWMLKFLALVDVAGRGGRSCRIRHVEWLIRIWTYLLMLYLLYEIHEVVRISFKGPLDLYACPFSINFVAIEREQLYFIHSLFGCHSVLGVTAWGELCFQPR